MLEKLMITSRTTEVDSVASRTISSYQGSTLNTDPNMVKIFSPLQEKSTLLSAAINRLKGKSEQKANDDIRDEKIDGLNFLLLSFSHHPDAAIKNAAINLLELFENYGLKMKEAGYSTESSLVNSLLGDYAQPEAVADIALVPQCAEYIAALQTAQTNFENTRLGFEEARATEGTFENASDLKKEVLDIVNKKLVPYLNVMEQLDEPTYGAFSRTIATIIADNNEVVKKRRKKEEPEE